MSTLQPSTHLHTSLLTRDLEAAQLVLGPSDESIVTEQEIAPLPETVQRYLHFMGAVGRPRVWSFSARWLGRFRMKRDGAWKRCEAWQYNLRDELARIFGIRIGSSLPVIAHDTYLRGRGKLDAKLLDLLPLAAADGVELDVGELVTYLNDAILLAPSILLGAASFAAVDDHTFDVALTDRGLSVRGRVRVDASGAPLRFNTTDRFFQDGEHRWQRTPWETPIDALTEVGSRRVIKCGRAVWQLPDGPFTYCELELVASSLLFNVQPVTTAFPFRD